MIEYQIENSPAKVSRFWTARGANYELQTYCFDNKQDAEDLEAIARALNDGTLRAVHIANDDGRWRVSLAWRTDDGALVLSVRHQLAAQLPRDLMQRCEQAGIVKKVVDAINSSSTTS